MTKIPLQLRHGQIYPTGHRSLSELHQPRLTQPRPTTNRAMPDRRRLLVRTTTLHRTDVPTSTFRRRQRRQRHSKTSHQTVTIRNLQTYPGSGTRDQFNKTLCRHYCQLYFDDCFEPFCTPFKVEADTLTALNLASKSTLTQFVALSMPTKSYIILVPGL